jgi:rhamnosyl/mannosyltransferase
MRIVQLGKYYPPVRGGMETVLQLICTGLLDADHDVVALVAGTSVQDRHEYLPAGGGGDTPSRAGRLVRAARLGVVASQPLTPTLPVLLARELRRFRPDLVHLHLPNPLAAAAWLLVAGCSNADYPLAIWYHADVTRQRLGARLVEPVVERCLARARGIAVSTRGLADSSRLLRQHRAKTVVIPFGIDLRRWAEPAGRSDGASGATRREGPFLFVGRLVRYKGIELLCRVVGELPSARLEIIGDGPLRSELRRLIARNRWDDRIALLGECDDAELQRRLCAARALVLPSLDRSETFGLVQVEAMATGCPVIASRLPSGTDEVTRDGVTGRLVTPGDRIALRDALLEVLEHPERAAAWGAAGRERAHACFKLENMVSRLVAWYLELLNEPPRRSRSRKL